MVQAAAAGVSALACAGLYAFLRSSPERWSKVVERTERERQQKAGWAKARELDEARWEQFRGDSAAQARLHQDLYLVIDEPAVPAQTEYDSTSNYGHVTERWSARLGDEVLAISLDHDGGGAFLTFKDPEQTYKALTSIRGARCVIGTWDGPPSPVQRRVAAFVGALRDAGHVEGVPCLSAPNYQELTARHYADYARQRGWPEERGGESAKAWADRS
ncbi:hypothetical protein [Qipengyuania flava]|uniref:hypothetical protein n=1 Tax=Qipengyuania flava TaxID=192812 RepID=UPI001C6271B9|nr:hypothetical protein [Qipengyuania flava]QYJ08135.1 hypothetical protein KUV82_05380 [Qipengyuania flava]